MGRCKDKEERLGQEVLREERLNRRTLFKAEEEVCWEERLLVKGEEGLQSKGQLLDSQLYRQCLGHLEGRGGVETQ